MAHIWELDRGELHRRPQAPVPVGRSLGPRILSYASSRGLPTQETCMIGAHSGIAAVLARKECNPVLSAARLTLLRVLLQAENFATVSPLFDKTKDSRVIGDLAACTLPAALAASADSE